MRTRLNSLCLLLLVLGVFATPLAAVADDATPPAVSPTEILAAASKRLAAFEAFKVNDHLVVFLRGALHHFKTRLLLTQRIYRFIEIRICNRAFQAHNRSLTQITDGNFRKNLKRRDKLKISAFCRLMLGFYRGHTRRL